MKLSAATLCGALVLFGCSQSSTSPSSTFPGGNVLLVVNSTGNSVAIYHLVGGAAVPVQTIAGANTGLNYPTGIGFSNNEIFVANNHADTVTVYAANASGDAAPLTTISGPATGLSHPTDIDIDSVGRVYVGNSVGNSVRIFAPTATGDAAPLASITGPDTALNHPVALHHDAAGNIYVVNTANSSVTIYHQSDVLSSVTGDVAPYATLAGALTGLVNPSGIVLDSAGDVYVTNDFPDSITVYPPNPNGNIAPTATIAGALTGLNAPGDIELAAGVLIIANAGGNNLLTFPTNGNGNIAPLLTVTGGLSQPNGLG